MPKEKMKVKRGIKSLSREDEGLIIILELFKLELVPQIEPLFECMCLVK